MLARCTVQELCRGRCAVPMRPFAKLLWTLVALLSHVGVSQPALQSALLIGILSVRLSVSLSVTIVICHALCAGTELWECESMEFRGSHGIPFGMGMHVMGMGLAFSKFHSHSHF